MIKWFKKILGNYLFPYTRFLEKELELKKEVIKCNYKEIARNKKIIALHEERAYHSDMVISCNEQAMERMRPMTNEEAKEYLTKNKS